MEIKINQKTVFVGVGLESINNDTTAILLLHGAACDHTVWSPLSRFLSSKNHSIITPDFPGHGISGGDPIKTIELLAEWTFELINSMKIEKLSIIGHSMGALVALELAPTLGKKLKSLSIIAGAAKVRVNEALINAAINDTPSAIKMMNLWSFSSSSHLEGAQIPGIRQNILALRLMERANPGVLANDLKASARYTNGMDAAKSITAPTKVVIGSHDIMIPPKESHKLAKILPDCEVNEIPGCGHMIMSEAPKYLQRLFTPLIISNK